MTRKERREFFGNVLDVERRINPHAGWGEPGWAVRNITVLCAIFLGFVLGLLCGCLKPNPPQPPAPPPPEADIVVKVRPIVLAKDGVPALELDRVASLFAQCDAAYAAAGMRFEIREPHVWEDAAVWEVADEAAWGKLVGRGLEYSRAGEHAVFVTRYIRAYGGAIGLGSLPPSYGIAVVGGAPSWVMPHEIGHSFGLPHSEPVRDCPRLACDVMSYCGAKIPPCMKVFDADQVRLMRQWAVVYPRRGVVTLSEALKETPSAKMRGSGETVICKPQ